MASDSTVPSATTAPVLPATPGASLSPAQIAQARKAAQDFEAMAIGQMLQPMFNTVDSSKGMFGGGQAEKMWKPMMVDEMAKMMVKNGGIGISDAVFREMLQMQEKKRG